MSAAAPVLTQLRRSRAGGCGGVRRAVSCGVEPSGVPLWSVAAGIFRPLALRGTMQLLWALTKQGRKKLNDHREDIVSLSEQEQRALREIEQALMADDPKFGRAVVGDNGFGGGGLTLRGVALFVLGLVLLIAGVALSQQTLWFVVLGVFGFLVMFGSGVWMLRGKGSGKSAPSVRSGRSTAKPGGNSLGDKMEENFRRRFEEQ